MFQQVTFIIFRTYVIKTTKDSYIITGNMENYLPVIPNVSSNVVRESFRILRGGIAILVSMSMETTDRQMGKLVS